MANELSKYDIVAGIGAALGGRAGQYMKDLQATQQQREMALYQDALTALNMTKRANYQGVIDLTEDRMDILNRMGIPYNETLAVNITAQKAMQGDQEAIKTLNEGLFETVQKGYDLGLLDRPAQQILSAGQSIVERQPDGTYRTVTTAPAAARTPTPQTELGKLESDYEAGIITKTQYDAQRKAIELSMDSETFDLESKLRDEFNKNDVVKVFNEQVASFGRINASVSDPSAAGDLALIFNFMKLLDPGSVVREGEFANAQNAAGVPERVVNVYNNLIKGERLNEKQRKDFFDRANMLYGKAKNSFDRQYERYKKLAERQDIDPSLVVYDYSYQEQTPVFGTIEELEAYPNLVDGQEYQYRGFDEEGNPVIYTVVYTKD